MTRKITLKKQQRFEEGCLWQRPFSVGGVP